MTQTASASRSGSPPVEPASGSISVDFETAQRALFDAVGPDTRSRSIEAQGGLGRIPVVDVGLPHTDLPLVFVHGTAAFGAIVGPLMASFDDTGMIAVDRPGYGLGDAFVYTEANIRG